MDNLIAIGFEISAHKVAFGIVDSHANILSNQRATYKPEIGKGVIPRDAADHHAEVMPTLLRKALDQAKLDPQEIDLVCFTQGSGMGPCLRVDAIAGRTLAVTLDKPIVGVNHQVAHVEIGRLIGQLHDPVVLYVSGGNSQVIAYSHRRYHVFGETLDIPLGNCLDVFGREMMLDASSAPMGRIVEELASTTDEFVPLPYTVKGMDLSFSGILTAAIRKVKEEGFPVEVVANSLQETAFAMVTEVAERALAHLKKKELLVTGGVASNNRLKEMLSIMADGHDAKFAGLPPATAIDNGVMIAWTGLLMYQAGYRQHLTDTLVRPHFRPEEVDVIWR